MDKDLKEFVAACPNCQTHQRQRVHCVPRKGVASNCFGSEYLTISALGNRSIAILPEIPTGNKLDHYGGGSCRWVAAKKEMIADFIYNEIYMSLQAPQEILTDGGKNMWTGVVQRYLEKIGLLTSPYHPWTNGRVKRLNRILGGMFGKLLLGEPTN
jgi:hypothetical protein